jgi:hypothetical protein
MKNKVIILLAIFAAMMLLMVINAQSQTVVFSSWASAQVVHAVEVDKPVVKYDTSRNINFPGMEILNTFMYKDFRIEIVKNAMGVKLVCISGSAMIILRPEDEYDILEKLIPLTR